MRCSYKCSVFRTALATLMSFLLVLFQAPCRLTPAIAVPSPDGVYYRIDGTTLCLTSTDGDGWTPADQSNWQWESNHDITKVVIEDAIAPYTCEDMFSGLWYLKDIEGLGNLDTSNVTNMSWMFGSCSSLTSLDVSSFDMSNVKTINEMFYGCSSLTSLDLSGWDTSHVTDMHYLLNDCISLTEIEGLGNLDTSNVTDMSMLFAYCESLTSLDLSGWDTSHVTNMTSMFEGCKSMTQANVSNLVTATASNISSMFRNCSSLTSLDLSGWDTSSVTDALSLISGCASLESMVSQKAGSTDIDLGWTMYEKDNPDSPAYTTMPSGCMQMTSVPDNRDFYYRIDDGTLFLGNGKRDGYDKCNQHSWPWTDNPDITKVVIEDDIAPTTCNSMFSGLTSLTSIEGLENLDTSHVADMKAMFATCESLADIDAAQLDTAAAADMSNMFADCVSLESLDLSGWDTSHATNTAYMFGWCDNLESLDLSNWDTGSVTDMSYMFHDCKSIESLDVSSFDTSSVTNMSSLFDGCHSLTSLDLSNLDIREDTHAYNLFDGCTALTTILTPSSCTNESVDLPATMYEKDNPDSPAYTTMPASSMTLRTVPYGHDIYYRIDDGTLRLRDTGSEGWTEANQHSWQWTNRPDITKVVVEDRTRPVNCAAMFHNLPCLTEVEGLENLDISDATDLSEMFANCLSLTSLDLSDWDTSNVTDMHAMFQNCLSLQSLDLSGWDTSGLASPSDTATLCDCTNLQRLATNAKGHGFMLPYEMQDESDPTSTYIYSPLSKTLTLAEGDLPKGASPTTLSFRTSLDGKVESLPTFDFHVHKADGTVVGDAIHNDANGSIYVDTKSLPIGRYYLQEDEGEDGTITYDDSKAWFDVIDASEATDTVPLPQGGRWAKALPVTDIIRSRDTITLHGLTTTTSKADGTAMVSTQNILTTTRKALPYGSVRDIVIDPTPKQVTQLLGATDDSIPERIRWALWSEQPDDAQADILSMLSGNQTAAPDGQGHIPEDFHWAILIPSDTAAQPVITALAVRDTNTIPVVESTDSFPNNSKNMSPSSITVTVNCPYGTDGETPSLGGIRVSAYMVTDEDGQSQFVGSYLTDENGSATIPVNGAGTYCAMAYNPPAGYQLSPSHGSAKVADGGTANITLNLLPTQEVKVMKTDSSSGKLLDGATFSLYALVRDGGDAEPSCLSATEDASMGEGTSVAAPTASNLPEMDGFRWVLIGTKDGPYQSFDISHDDVQGIMLYCLVEDTAPFGYAKVAPIYFGDNEDYETSADPPYVLDEEMTSETARDHVDMVGDTIEVRDDPIPTASMPETGMAGLAIHPILVGGFLLVLATARHARRRIP